VVVVAVLLLWEVMGEPLTILREMVEMELPLLFRALQLLMLAAAAVHQVLLAAQAAQVVVETERQLAQDQAHKTELQIQAVAVAGVMFHQELLAAQAS
jgi:hypothetical protein